MATPTEESPDEYVVFGLLTPKSNFHFNTAFDRICDAFLNRPGGGSEIQSDGTSGIVIDPQNLGLFVLLADGPEVIDDSQRLAEELGDAPEAALVASCARRIEFGMQWGDPRGNTFPEFERLLGVLRSFRGVILLDPRDPAGTLGGRFTPPPGKKRRKRK